MEKNKIDINRREFIRKLGLGAGSAMALMALEPLQSLARNDIHNTQQVVKENKMTYRVQHGSGEHISLLGFGMMRLPRDNQELVNKMVDYALEHGVNYFDTAAAYGGGQNEVITGIALKRHPRDKYYIATKMSNSNPRTWSFEESKKMYERSLKNLQVDYIDYYLLHSVGGGGMDTLKGRFLDNGVLDFLMKEREAGRIRHLGFSYHGDVEVFDYLVDHNDEYHWDFVQIQMNFLDWRHASLRQGRRVDADAEYLYNKLEKAGIQAVIMEPFRGGALGRITENYKHELTSMRPNDTVAQWAFRWVGSFPNILTTLSGMNHMEHLIENVNTHSPLEPCTNEENILLEKIADEISGIPLIPCTACEYCLPCPYNVNIPLNFSFYNEALNSKKLPEVNKKAKNYKKSKKEFIDLYNKAIPAENRATQCMDCEECLPKCPQQIRIPNQMSRITELLRIDK